MQFGICQWETGVRNEKRNFTKNDNVAVYEHHLKALQGWRVTNKQDVENFQMRLFTKAV